MKTTTVETSQLSGAALDWAVAKAVPQKHCLVIIGGEVHLDTGYPYTSYSPTTDWDCCGPLIEDLVVDMGEDSSNEDEPFYAETRMCAAETGETYLIAVCRAIAFGKFGSEVEVPAELVEAEGI